MSIIIYTLLSLRHLSFILIRYPRMLLTRSIDRIELYHLSQFTCCLLIRLTPCGRTSLLVRFFNFHLAKTRFFKCSVHYFLRILSDVGMLQSFQEITLHRRELAVKRRVMERILQCAIISRFCYFAARLVDIELLLVFLKDLLCRYILWSWNVPQFQIVHFWP